MRLRPKRDQARSDRALNKVFRERVVIEVVDAVRYGRTVAKVWQGDRDINRELVREGHAWVYRQYLRDGSSIDDETSAKQASVGLWGRMSPVRRWEWRARADMRADAAGLGTR